MSEGDNSGTFECNICLDPVSNPVVTVCGHLFCWKCLYQWIKQQPTCPICKAGVTEESVIPLYGRGGDKNSRDHKEEDDVPSRPAGQRPQPQPVQQNPFGNMFRGFGIHIPDFAFPQDVFGQFRANPAFRHGRAGGGGQHPPRNPEDEQAEMFSKFLFVIGVAILFYVISTPVL